MGGTEKRAFCTLEKNPAAVTAIAGEPLLLNGQISVFRPPMLSFPQSVSMEKA
jgi:hypothetical protein